MCFPVTVDSKSFTNKEKGRIEHENSEKITDDKTGTSGNVTWNFRYSGCHRMQEQIPLEEVGCRRFWQQGSKRQSPRQ